jgi:predicted PurR-regulated permease PerM
MSADAPPRPTRIEPWIGVAAVALLVLACLLVLSPFISAALWAAILCFTTWPLFTRLETLLGGRRSLAALIATLALAAIIAAPFAILGATLASNLSDLIAATLRMIHEGPLQPPAWVARIPVVGTRLLDYLNVLNQSSSARLEGLAKLLPAAKELGLRGGRILGAGIIQIVLSLLIAFFFYRDGEAAARQLSAAINRIGGDEGGRLLEVAGATIRAVVYGVLGTALLQGVLGGLGFLIAGVPGATFLGFVTFLVGGIPGGPHLIALPAAFWLYEQGSTGWAIFIIVWGFIVGSVDNVVKPLLISRGGTTPLILVMLGVFGGVMAFGLVGLFLGPTFLAVGYSLFEEWASTRADGGIKR